MSFVKRLKNPFIQQYLIEIVFPLVGYFFFDWDILIIGVYYLVDHFCSQVLFFRRAHWVNIKGGIRKGPQLLLIAILVFTLLFTAEIMSFGYFIMGAKELTLFQVWEAFFAFAKSELWLLIPIVLFVYHFKDQFTFYMPRHYLKFSYPKLIKWDVVGNLIILILFILFGFLWVKFKIADVLVIFIFLGFKISFDLTIKKKFTSYSLII